MLEASTPPEPPVSAAPAYGETKAAEYVPQTYDEMVAEVDERARAVLSEEERAIIEDTFAARGMDPTQVKIVGRMILEDDMYVSADDILAVAAETVEKGTTKVTSSAYARMNGSNFEVRRPYFGFGNTIRLIVPNHANGSENTTLINLMKAAAANVTGAADDCIGTANIDVISQTGWDGLMIGQRQYIGVSVRYGDAATVCPSSDDDVRGCAPTPTVQNVFISAQVSQSRMAPGRWIGLNSAVISNSSDAGSVKTATHELLHILGVGHSYLQGPEEVGVYLGVPGSMRMSGPTSIMRPGTNTTTNYFPCPNERPCFTSLTMSADDKFTLDTLYSPMPGSTSCSPINYETTCSQACTRVTENNVNIAGDCCWCNGNLKTYVKAAWAQNVFLCNSPNPTPPTPPT